MFLKGSLVTVVSVCIYTGYSISPVLWSYKLQKDVRAFSGGENADALCQCYVFFALAVNKSKILSYYEGYTLYYWITGDFLSLIRRRRQELSVSRSHITEMNPTIKYLFHCFLVSWFIDCEYLYRVVCCLNIDDIVEEKFNTIKKVFLQR